MTRRPIESYLRVTVEIPGGSIEAGLQRDVGEPLYFLRDHLRDLLAEEALILNGDGLDDDNGQRLTDALHQRMEATWRGRAWFVELWLRGADGAEQALSQVYAPFGTPRAPAEDASYPAPRT